VSPTDVTRLPAAAPAAALAALPAMGPSRLRLLLGTWPPDQAWAHVAGGTARSHPRLAEALPAQLCRSWQRAASEVEPAALSSRHDELGVVVTLHGTDGYPAALADDVEPPAVLFHRGELSALDAPRVAIVGTRRCTAAGARTARELGRSLAESGVAVVSGLALGIDGAAHRGSLEVRGAPPIGVVGNGLDVAYPSQHRRLWEAVADRGLLLGEAPAGARPSGWRFPARNRIIAALADLVVVVESHARGGSMHTVDEAAARSVEVMAVPGSVRSPASAGTNRLLQDGCAPVLGADDVLVALGLTPGGRRRAAAPAPPPGDPTAVLAVLDGTPATFEHLAIRTGLSLDRLGLAVETLVDGGWIAASGGWFELAGPGPGGR
jgi:DNA processing protein